MKKYLFIVITLFIVIIGFDFWRSMYKSQPIVQKVFTIDAETKSIPLFVDTFVYDNSQVLNWYWDFYLRLFKYDTRLKSGEYELTQDSMSRVELIQVLLAGPDKKRTQTLTFIEGWRNEDYVSYLEEQDIRLNKEVEKTKVSDVRAKYEFLSDAPNGSDLQGFLYPDTYEFYTDATEEEILYKLLDTFGQKITKEMRDDIKKSGRNLYDVIILASIIEKEVRTLESKRNVSGIFYNRLDINMALQSDATVNYITQSGRDRSTLEDLKIDSPYNTYKYRGLPPGPIANPGYDSIYAAIYPYETDYVYFLTTQEGDIYYAKTFEQHVRNKNKYLN